MTNIGVNGSNSADNGFNILHYINSKNLSEKEVSVFTKAFEEFDTNKDKVIDESEYRKAKDKFLETFINVEIQSDINAQNEIKKNEDLNSFIESEINQDLQNQKNKKLNNFIEKIISNDLKKRNVKNKDSE